MGLIEDLYSVEIELKDGRIVDERERDIKDKVARITYRPKSKILPSHTIVFSRNYKFIKRFSRTFMKQRVGVVERIHCVVTNKFRMYLFSSCGKTIITDKDYELYL